MLAKPLNTLLTPPRHESLTKPSGQFKPLIMVYDDRCSLCQRGKALLTALDVYGQLGWVSLHDEAILQTLPGVTNLPPPQQRDQAIHAVSHGGQWYVGANAVAQALCLCPWPMTWVGKLLLWPVAQPVAHRAYGWIAERRHCLLPPLPKS
jgi:predicted DCC family thiol-disulfide oxidoreductase YuxK